MLHPLSKVTSFSRTRRRLLAFCFDPIRRASPAFRAACAVDLLRALLIACGTSVLLLVDMSALYHLIRVQAVVKLYIMFNILEVCLTSIALLLCSSSVPLELQKLGYEYIGTCDTPCVACPARCDV